MSTEEPLQKRCYKCGETKSLDHFHIAKREKDGHRGDCKTCRSKQYIDNADIIREKERIRRAANPNLYLEKRRAYYTANAQVRREKRRIYNAKNADQIREYSRTYYAANAQARREKRRAYYAANADASREYSRAYKAANPDLTREYKRAYRAAHPDFHRAESQRRRARIEANGGDFSPAELRALRIAQAGICAYCERQYDPDFLSIDHVIPLDQGGPHEAGNIVLACPCCNSSKKNRTPEQWTNRWYMHDPRLCTKRWPGRKHK